MFFSVGVETPDNDAVAWGMVVPALCNEAFGCYSAADDRASIATAAREAILLVLEEMIRSGKYRPTREAHMFFSVGVETPDNDAVAWGMVVPALCNEAFGCYSAADDRASIATAAREAILLVLEEMIRSGKYRPETIADAGHLVYAAHPDYRAYDSWFAIEVDLSGLEGRQQRINITLPDTLIQRIDNRVKASAGRYRDRSHFLAQAARHELREE